MVGIYSRVFKYRERPSSSPAENFLTEGLADLLGRFPPDVQREFICAMLPKTYEQNFVDCATASKRLRFITQFPILVGVFTKLPDMVVLLDDQPFVLFEIKINATEQQHTIRSEHDLEADSEQQEIVTQGQLQTYSNWIREQNTGEWPGAVVFLTHQTRAPDGFDLNDIMTRRTIHSIRTWTDVGRWLARHIDLELIDKTYCALTRDYLQFLKEIGLMNNYVTLRDLAATQIFLPSQQALRYTFRSIADAASSAQPKSKGGHIHAEFWPQGGVYWSYYYLNSKLNLHSSKFYLAFGISFPETGDFGSKDRDKLPQHEPFFFILLSDEWQKRKASELLTRIPENWLQINDRAEAVVVRPVSKFDANPDVRAAAVKTWAQEEVSRLVNFIPGFGNAPIVAVVEDEPT